VQQASMGLRDTDPTNDPTDPLNLEFDPLPNDVTLFPGQTFTRELFVELPNSDSAISIESPLVVSSATGEVTLAATEVYINAPTRAPGQFTVPDQANSLLGTTTEQVTIAAALSSQAFSLSTANDPATNSVPRSRFFGDTNRHAIQSRRCN
jgi:hypothetical protein